MALSDRDPRLSRRALLRGAAGAALAVPFLDSWPFARLAQAAQPKTPIRLLFIMTPNGANMGAWTPTTEGADYELPPTLAPLAPHRNQLLVLSGLTLDGARPYQDGPGDHARAGAAYLTCTHPLKTDGANIHAGISVDQAAARVIGETTAFASVELGTEASAQAGNCDSGYSCAYSSNLAWTSPSSPLAKEINPRRAFDRLFMDGDGMTPEKRQKRDLERTSVLDAVKDDAKKTREKLSANDRKKLDEYLDAIRTLEKRLAPAPKDRKITSTLHEPAPGIPGDYGEHIRRLHDVVKLAFETDTTRVMTLMCGNEGSNRSYPFIDVPEGHHDTSHHGKDATKLAKVARINKFHVEQLAYLLAQLKTVKEGNGTLLDSTLIVFGSGIGDGDAHLPHVRHRSEPCRALRATLLIRL
jgi:uncharacterized protein DUF1552